MFKTTIKNLLGHKIRVVITAVAIIAGVSFMSGTFILTDTITSAFNNLFADVNKGVDGVVRQKATFKIDAQQPGGTTDQRDLVPISLVPTIEQADGVQAAEASIFGVAFAIGKDNKPINPISGAPQFGGNWQTVQAMSPYRLAEGRAPNGPNEVVIDRGTAKRGKLALGDTLRIQALGPTRTAKVVGIATVNGSDNLAGASFVLMDTTSASAAFGTAGKAGAILVQADDGLSQAQLVERLQRAIPSGDEAITGDAYTKESQDSVQKGFSVFSLVLLVFAFIALLAGAFLIYNIFGIVVAQRTRELALLRAIGASRQQVLRSVLIEALATGVLASALGLLAGIGLAVGLTALLAAIGLDLSSTSIVIAPRTVFLSLFVGVLVTLLSSIIPALRASRVSPMAAIREVAVDDSNRSTVRVVFGTVFGVLGVLAMLGGISGKKAPPIGVGAVCLFITIVIFGPRLASPIIKVIGAWLPKVKGVTGQLARDNAMRNPRRTASTAIALILALTLVAALTIVFSSFTASINAAVTKGFKGDFQLSAGFSGAGLSPELASRLEKVPQVDGVAGLSFGTASLLGKGVTVWGTDGPGLKRVLDIGVDQGDLDRLVGDDTIALDRGVSDLFKLPIGSKLTLGFPSGQTQAFTVVATYTEAGLIGQGADAKFLLPRAAFARFEPAQAQTDLRVMVKAAKGVSVSAARTAVEQASKDFPTAKVQSLKEIQKAQTKQINQALSFFLVLLVFSIFIGFLGIAITLALSVIERTRELGLLRALGMDRKLMKSMVRWEAVLIALLGSTLGLGLGIVIGSALAAILSADIDTARVSLPFTRLILFGLGAALFGVLAAIYPARRAAKLNVLEAISTE